MEERAISDGTENNSHRLFFNRELSWVEFNRRVLEEAWDNRHPLLERVKFLSIFSSNFDEFVMIRVAGLRRQTRGGVLEAPPDGMTPSEQLAAIRTSTGALMDEAHACWTDDLLPGLNQEGIFIRSCDDLRPEEAAVLSTIFEEQIFPVLTPMALDAGHPFPRISNLSLNLAVVLHRDGENHIFSRVKVPVETLSRLIRIPPGAVADSGNPDAGKEYHFVFLEDLIAANIRLLFPEEDAITTYPFSVTRDADFEIEVDEASDLLTAIERNVVNRRVGRVVRLEMRESTPSWVRTVLASHMNVPSEDLYSLCDPLRASDLSELCSIDRPDLKDKPFMPSVPSFFEDGADMFQVIRSRDVMLCHPYESFTPVITFLRQAAADPDVLAIKLTLYRIGEDSPIIDTLIDARNAGKQVSVVVELKARFDEKNNIIWARALEEAGVHVVYGIVGLKVHVKMCMIVRREKGKIRTYVHLGSGNYNSATARIYTDIGYFTSDPDIASDVRDLFNALTGPPGIRQYRSLLVSFGKNSTMKEAIIDLIDEEIACHEMSGNGHIIIKINQLSDPDCISALYRASAAGVKVTLQVRGLCSLVPGVPGVSENIMNSSIVGRFLEHSRIYYFHQGGKDIVLSGSADLMPRNLERRVEVLYPVTRPEMKDRFLSILRVHCSDTENARMQGTDGLYVRMKSEKNSPCDAQQWMVDHRGEWNVSG
ncbi:polyphosphate kinase 1 [Methanogenium marinum]|uniref:Polyphosphate kinase n=1 Tax=Methanogenium marinum TaxID=348610 RepID=A0A9Q4PYE4_9EURY|nr:polyphosphate kinase 1 [Methanogenium marinum]MDE4908548.1 polyphosphate kinase 1 [Methanogenium marinum]